MELVYQDRDIVVVIKPARVLSTDEPGGMPELVRQALGDPNANVRTVHRLDRTVSGLMVLARRSKAASELSRQIREGAFQKEYVAVIHGKPVEDCGLLRDLLLRNKQERKTYVVHASVIVHIFDRTTREFYTLEHLWRDGTEINIDELLTPGGIGDEQ